MHSSPSISLYLYLSLLLPLLIPTHAANHLITVGPGLSYTPNTTTAAPGDTLTFHFDPSHHDIAQGEFGKPCDYKPGGFYSGEGAMVPNGHDQFVVTVNDSAPLWFYCSIRGHCQGGMVGVVNVPESGDTLSAYAAAAAGTDKSTMPPAIAGGVTKPESEVSSSSAAIASVSSSPGSAPPSSATSSPDPSSPSESQPPASSTTPVATSTTEAATPAATTGAAGSLRENVDGFFGLGLVFALVGAVVAGMV